MHKPRGQFLGLFWPPHRGPIYTYNVDTFPKFLTPPPPLLSTWFNLCTPPNSKISWNGFHFTMRHDMISPALDFTKFQSMSFNIHIRIQWFQNIVKSILRNFNIFVSVIISKIREIDFTKFKFFFSDYKNSWNRNL